MPKSELRTLARFLLNLSCSLADSLCFPVSTSLTQINHVYKRTYTGQVQRLLFQLRPARTLNTVSRYTLYLHLTDIADGMQTCASIHADMPNVRHSYFTHTVARGFLQVSYQCRSKNKQVARSSAIRSSKTWGNTR
jgi:hypothetical protein